MGVIYGFFTLKYLKLEHQHRTNSITYQVSGYYSLTRILYIIYWFRLANRMRYVTKTNVITINGQTWWINARTSGVYTAMLKKMLGQLEAMLSYHSKINVIRFDLRQDIYTKKKTQITVFNRRLFKWLKRHYKLKRIGFIWCREKEKANHQHYHYVLIIDGHKVEQARLIANKVKEIWGNISGSYWLPKNCYYNLKRDDYKETQNAIFRISYLAKARGKGNRPPQTKDYGTSRIKLKPLNSSPQTIYF